MANERSLVRASDIGLWAFCNRAWWLARVQGTPHRNPALLQYGADAHRTHGQRVVRGYRYAHLGMILLLLAALVAGFTLLFWLWLR
jgi:hypothetical protein